MSKAHPEDLFQESTMTFGEHLEELRVCLLRGLMGLMVGLAVGLIFANRVVVWIQSPLTVALEKHYANTAEDRLKQLYGGDVPKDVAQLSIDEGFAYEEVYFERQQLKRLLQAQSEKGTADHVAPNPAALIQQDLALPTSDMIKTRMWRKTEAKLTVLSPHEAFMIWLKAGFVFGLILASPYIFYQIWIFVAAGLYTHERGFVYIFLPFSLILFLAGAALAFFFVFGPVLNFLFGFARWMDIEPDLRISEVISFVLILPLGFGISFQLPLVMLFLHRIGVFSVAAYLEKWRIAVLIIFVISMLLTPADPVSMLLMAVPLTLLYFLGVALCQWMPRGRNPFGEAYDPA